MSEGTLKLQEELDNNPLVVNLEKLFAMHLAPNLEKKGGSFFYLQLELFTRPQLGAFFVLKFLRSRGLSSTVSKVRSDRKVLFEQKNGPLIAVNGR